MARIGLLHPIDRQNANSIDRQLVKVGVCLSHHSNLILTFQRTKDERRKTNNSTLVFRRSSFVGYWRLFQSARNFSIPLSVSGCFILCSITLKGQVAISAPASAESIIWRGWRIEADSTLVVISGSWR